MDYLKQAELAIDYLQQSEEAYASLKATHQAEKERLKIVEASCMLDSDAKTVKDRETEAKTNKAYKEALEDWQRVMEEFYLIEAKRKRAELTIDMYRSVNSALKKGNI